MTAAPRPTDAEKVDAVLRLMDEVDAAHAAISRAKRVLRERTERGSHSGPLFPFVGDKADRCLTGAREALWALREVVAPQFLDSTRSAARPDEASS